MGFVGLQTIERDFFAVPLVGFVGLLLLHEG